VSRCPALKIGVLPAGQGDIAEARAAYKQAIDSGDPEIAARAKSNLRALLAEHDM
jgi:hypothetical protein